MWCTHYEWRTGKYIGQQIDMDSKDPIDINTQRKVMKRKNRKGASGNESSDSDDPDNEDEDKKQSSAPLLGCKTGPGRSHYLYATNDNTITLRARLRANRAYTQEHRHRFRKTADPITPKQCTYPICAANNTVDSVEHILLHCPRHQQDRQTLSQKLHIYPKPLTVPLITGATQHNGTAAGKELFLSILALTTTYLLSILSSRLTDVNLLPLSAG
jgi:hypothetical protein